MPFISVIIPTYNRCRPVREAIESVQAQSFRDFELIVVDDGSEDETCRALSGKGSPDGYLYLRHGGVSRARNAGVRAARAEWIAFLDSDDLWLPQKLQRQVDALMVQPEFQLCYTDEIWIRRGVRVNPMKKHQKYSGWIFERCLPLCLISPSSILLRRQLLEEEGGFDESLPVCEDYDLWLRLTCMHPVLFLEEKLIVKRGGHPDQLSHSEWGMDRFRLQSLLRLAREKPLTSWQEQAVWKELIRKAQILQQGAAKRNYREEASFYERKIQEAEDRLNQLAGTTC